GSPARGRLLVPVPPGQGRDRSVAADCARRADRPALADVPAGRGLRMGSRVALVSAGTAAPMLALFALAIVMANTRGALAPFARVGSADRRTRRVLGLFGVGLALSSLIVAVVLVANTGTAMDPAPALLGLFNGGF